jgi:serine/threonine protein kinase
LGEGASGVIYRAALQLQDEPAPRAVAVKLFKGAVTSDGLPDCEMAACLRGGVHANLIPVLGKVSGHPSDAHGLVMGLIEPRFANLAGPPSLASCTRDIYRDEARFDLASVLGIASGIAKVASHLHRRGVMHGDLYAHNILHGGAGRALLGDFGAASFYDTGDRALAVALQRLEARAYGCLLEELLERCGAVDEVDAQSPVAVQLAALKTRCLSEDIDSRPLFDEIVASIAALDQDLREGVQP